MRRIALVAALLPTLSGCSLTEVTTTAAEDLVVVEALLQRRDDVGFSPSSLTVFLHRTIGGEQGLSVPVNGAEVRVIRESGAVVELHPIGIGECVSSTPVQGTGSCYRLLAVDARAILPGETVRLTVRTAEGESMEAVTVVPEAFEVRTAADGAVCRVEPDAPLEVVWGRSPGAWAYLNETSLHGLPVALSDLGLDIPDPLDLLGLSVSSSDTTIVFPGEFGIFDRADLDQPLALALQKGLPDGATASISIAAVDRNYVNWVRGGNFNPSGQVRVPSVRGDGTGYFGSGVVRTFDVHTSGDAAACARFETAETR